jgi:acetyltransferase-like isoleucine patch superfamily enzyme
VSSDQQHRLDQAKTTLFGRWLSPQEKIEPHLSTPGYELPDISDFGWHAVGTGTGNNWVVAPGEMANWAQNRRFDFASDAEDNVIVLGRDSTTSGRMLFRGSSNLAIFLGASASVNPVNVHFFSNHHVFFWGSGCTSNTTTFELGSDRTKIIVGQDCMFSAGIAVRTHDEHGILDLDSGAVLNVAGDVHFEPHVWVGLEASVLKGVRVGFGSVIATRAVVTRAVPRKSIVAGVPARVIRRNIGWVRERIPGPGALQYLATLDAQFGGD